MGGKMNHDHVYCIDYTEKCPKRCFRAQLVRDLEQWDKELPEGKHHIVSWTHIKGTMECPLKEVINEQMD